MFLGGDSSGSMQFNGQLKQLTIWSDPAMSSFPAGSFLDQVCEEELYHTSQFELDTDYYWPKSDTFGADWLLVRHIDSATDGFLLRNSGGSIFSDLLSGTAISQSFAEVKAYDLLGFFPHFFRFRNDQSKTLNKSLGLRNRG